MCSRQNMGFSKVEKVNKETDKKAGYTFKGEYGFDKQAGQGFYYEDMCGEGEPSTMEIR